jgi:endonuclease III
VTLQRLSASQSAPSDSALRQKAHTVTQLLHDTYGSPRHGNKTDPLDELIFIILSQMTTHPSFNRVFTRLKETSCSWDRLASMPLRRLKYLIKDAGLSNQKAPRIRAIVRAVIERFGRASLDELANMDDGSAERFLTSLPGVGLKTAKCVMMYSLGRHVLPVDTHVGRLGRRLGLIRPDVTRTQVHTAIEAVVEPSDRYAFHVNALSHGRRTCLPLRPRCGECNLRPYCQSVIRTESP